MKAQNKFYHIVLFIAVANLMQSIMPVRLSYIKTMSLDSFAMQVPPPIAIPMSAYYNAGASFTPSPIMATIWPWDWSFLIKLILSWGKASATTLSIPHSFPKLSATYLLSPVTIIVWIPLYFN